MFRKILILFCICSLASRAEITTPYPEVIEIKQINGAEKERLRMCHGHKKYDKQPTGFYVESGKTVEVNVEIITPATGRDVMPVLTVGTLGFNVAGRNTGTTFTLKEGVNTITNHSGGLIYLSYIYEGVGEPRGLAKITFTANSQHIRAPRYIYGVTSDAEFTEMLNTYSAVPDVIFHSDYIIVCATHEAAVSISRLQDKLLWMNSIHALIEKEDEISGMDNNDPNPIHHRLKAGEVRYLLVENTSSSPHASSSGYTGYPNGSRSRYLTRLGSSNNNSWMLGHELGHQHQQPAYQINQATESTVNIYSYVVERYFQSLLGNNDYNRTSAVRWTQAQNTYLKLPVEQRVYDMPDAELEAIIGFNRDELRFMPWEHLFLIFGDQFYKTLHRVVREEKVIGGAADERRAYLIWKASQVTGYDLIEFFNQWGIRVTDASIKADLQEKMADALKQETIIPLPVTVEECLMVTGQSRPDWTPIPLIGITSSKSDAFEPLDRTDWSITTSIEGPFDSTVGGDDPEYIIDENRTTAFSFVKPGNSYEGITAPSNYIPSFTIDRKSEQTFNAIIYVHRTANNNLERLRARQISVYGSNDGEDFLPFVENHVIDYVKNADEILIEFQPVSYRYIKVIIEDWNKNPGEGYTIQVAEFYVGNKDSDTVMSVKFPVKTETNKLLIYPNPVKAQQQFSIKLENEAPSFLKTLSIYTLAGNKLCEQTTNGNLFEQSIAQSGIYIVEIKQDGKGYRSKIIVL